ncbi:HNH endonuclease signature motif containing protein [Mesorhizobium sp. Root552]|uniref:HNH endonuclease signature motif containing protein n=1 Tax=Mesorhizobium sp. Root552 TaxID=1736555 RepID=UPI0006FEEDC1|nr:HNH endonuclease signature motif containing protein [Mesorhizobium sp. Root552]
MAELTYDHVSEVLNYNPKTGKFRWKIRSERFFKSGAAGGQLAAAFRWNKMYAGTEALNCPGTQGYLSGAIFGQSVKAHRVAWLLATGEWPSGDIDHLNGDPADNRICNLRDGTTSDNMKNQRRYKNNRSGHVGVSFRGRNSRWAAYIDLDGTRRNLGEFRTLEDAIAAREKASAELGFSPRHGMSDAA